MSIRFQCDCGQFIKAPEDTAGSKFACPFCGFENDVPDPSKAPPPAPTGAPEAPVAPAKAQAVPAAGGTGSWMLCMKCRTHRLSSVELCPKCGADISHAMLDTRAPKQTQKQTHDTRPFAVEVVRAIFYPICIRGILLLIVATVALTVAIVIQANLPNVINFGIMATHALMIVLVVVMSAYVGAHIVKIIRSAGSGETKMPDWPEPAEAFANFFIYVAPAVIVMLLPMLVLQAVGVKDIQNRPTLIAACLAVGALYVGIGTVAAVMLRSPMALSPHIVGPAWAKIPGAALLSGGLLWVALAGWDTVFQYVRNHYAGDEASAVSILALAAASAFAIYVLFVAARVAGAAHWTYRRKLGWFKRL